MTKSGRKMKYSLDSPLLVVPRSRKSDTPARPTNVPSPVKRCSVAVSPVDNTSKLPLAMLIHLKKNE